MSQKLILMLKKLAVPIVLVIINSLLMQKLAILKTDTFLYLILINSLPLLLVLFPGFFAEILRFGVWQHLASDYDQGVHPTILIMTGWIILIIIFFVLIAQYLGLG